MNLFEHLDKRQGPNSTSSTPTNLSSNPNGHLKNGQHLNCNDLLDQENSDCLDDNDLSTNGLLLDDEDSLDESKSSLIMNSNMNNLNTSINQQHLQLDNNLDCQSNQLSNQSSLSMSTNAAHLTIQPSTNELNTTSSNTQNSITNSIKIEPKHQQFSTSQPLSSSLTSAIHNNTQQTSSSICTSQNYPIYQVESNYPSLEKRKLIDPNCRQSDCIGTDCRSNPLCNTVQPVDSYSSSDSFNLLHNALSTTNESSNQNLNPSNHQNLNSNLNNSTNMPTSATVKRRNKRSSYNQKLNNSTTTNLQQQSTYFKTEPTNCSPPSMIPTPPMENTLNCSSNQSLHSNLVQSPLINDLPANSSADFYSQPRSSILGATLQNRQTNLIANQSINQSSNYASMELINNHRRAYPSPTSSTSSAYMSPNSQTLNHSPNSNFPNVEQSNKFSTSMIQPTNHSNTYQMRVDQTNIFHSYNNQPIQSSTTTDNQTSFNCENNTVVPNKTYTAPNQCLSTNNIYNAIEQQSYTQPINATAINDQAATTFNSTYSNSMYLSNSQPPQTQFMQSNQNYQPNGYFNSNNYQTSNGQLNNGQFSFEQQQYNSSSFLNSSNKSDLFYTPNDNLPNGYHSGTDYSNNQMINDFTNTNDYFTDSIYNNSVCQSFNTDNFNAQDYQQLS